jgi:DNA-binding LacI/PurR family transcriptional regulator
MPRQITLQRIADEVGCSAKTVSNAFNRPDQLSAALRTRILDRAKEMGYAGPNPLAAGLRRGRVGAIGFAYANPLPYAFMDPVSVELLAGIASVAEGSGAGLLLVPGSAHPERSAAAVGTAVIDGLIIGSLADDDPLAAAALGRGLPMAIIDQPRPEIFTPRTRFPRPSWVGIDDRAAARAAAEHVLDLGHRRLGVVSFGLHRSPRPGLADQAEQARATYAVTRDRLLGYRDAVTRAGLDFTRVPVAAGTDSTPAEGAAATELLLGHRPVPTAILCLSDRLAEGALHTLSSHGLSVPGDMSVVGFDDAAPAVLLGLTTVRQPVRRKGELAARALVARIFAQPAAELQRLPTQLVRRSSTGPPGQAG